MGVKWQNLKKRLYLIIGNVYLRICYYCKKEKRQVLKSGILGFIGFLLSPLSWWNDIFVNVPLAYVFSYVVCALINIFVDVQKIIFVAFFILGYFITNLIGFLLLHYSIANLTNKQKFSLKSQVVVSLFYTILIVVLSYLNVFNFLPDINIVPNFIK